MANFFQQDEIDHCVRKNDSGMPKVIEIIKPEALLVDLSNNKCIINYYPEKKEIINTQSSVIIGISLRASIVSGIDDLSLLFKTTVDSFGGGATDLANLEKIRVTVERVYNSIHQETVKIEAVELVKPETTNNNTLDRIILVSCPACHVTTKFVVTWDLILARSNNPSPVMNFLFKGNKTECGHSFVAFVDRAFKVKGCDAIDM